MARVGAMRSLASARLSLSWSSLKVASLALLRPSCLFSACSPAIITDHGGVASALIQCSSIGVFTLKKAPSAQCYREHCAEGAFRIFCGWVLYPKVRQCFL